jgi:glycosyltransferase involved in cell wall biosynthesis
MVHAPFALSLAAMVAAQGGTEFALVNPKSSIVAASRNRGAKEALGLIPDWVLFLDSDLSFPANALARLLAADKDIIGCNYVMRAPPHASLACPKGSARQEVSGVAEVDRLPTGVLLIRAAVFDQMNAPWFAHPLTEDGELLGEDYFFCDQARLCGFSIWMDTDLSLEIVHWGAMGFRWSPSGYETIEDAVRGAR